MIYHKEETSRIYFFDNLKAILVTLVVFGHVIEPRLWISIITISYSFIYLFHIPLFVFCSGYFARCKPKKILTKLIIPYILFQIAYILFERIVFGNTSLHIQFTRPYWMLWYLFAVTVWTLCIPFLDRVTGSTRSLALTISASLILGILPGFVNRLGYYFSLARIIYCFPFFIIGFCIKKTGNAEALQRVTAKPQVRYTCSILAMGTLVWLYFHHSTVDVLWFYGSFSYYSLPGYTFLIRILCYIAAFVLSVFLLAVTPGRKTFFSYIGQRTMPVFLLHGFIMRLLMRYNFYSILEGRLLFFASIAITLLIVWMLSSGLLRRAYQFKQGRLMKLNKSTRKYRKKLEENLSGKDISFAHISDYKKVADLKSNWLSNFASGIKTSDIFIDEFMWNIFSYKKLPCIEGDDATAYFLAQNKTQCYILFEHYKDAYYLESATPLTKEDLIDNIDFPSKDLYIVSKRFNWTYVLTHESDLGPYYYQRKKACDS